MFKSREEAGRLLAGELMQYRGKDAVVIALPRGGLPVAYEVAKALNAPIDIFFVKKIPSPYNKEAGIGAVSENGYYFVNQNAVNSLGITRRYIENETKEILQKIAQKRAIYNKKREDIKGKTVIVVDDGIATGSSMNLAIDALKKEGAKEVVIAAPVAPIEAANTLKQKADALYVLQTPPDFMAVGQYYADFHQLDDSEVTDILEKSRNLGK